ncbi:alpha/beta-hydrolase [Daedalea quercina L-15889]|uniref:Alpha/beta-hydrolase n=1 Tax=Daedalea quercina L-15889 TaxID=1314783 RepID=A0A165NLP9_9APHY|nr:alpha/beta-hydrolase [Daedalea quercina L-15889]
MADPQVPAQPNQGFLARAPELVLLVAGLYVVAIALLPIPVIQRFFIYQHRANEPFHGNYAVPERYVLAPGKTLNLGIRTPDNITLGAWFILADPCYQSLRASAAEPLSQPSLETIEDAIKSRPTMLYLHGAFGSRSTSWRIQHYIAWTARLKINVFAIDYRGFGDSSGSPYKDEEDVFILGHSLGTGVSGKLAPRLERKGVKPRGVVLLAPFSSVSSLIETFEIWGIPILRPLQSFSLGRKFLKSAAREVYDTLSVINEFNAPILIAHATDDREVPYSHSRTLIDKLLNQLLPPEFPIPGEPGTPVPHEHAQALAQAQKKRSDAHAALVRKVDVPEFGTVEQFEGTSGTVVYVQAHWGAHGFVGLQEGVQDVIASTLKLGVHA